MKFLLRGTAIIALLGFMLSGSLADAAQSESRTITVSGIGKSAAEPDQAEIQVSATANDAAADVAMGKASAIASSLLKAALKNGVAKIDVQTGNISLSPIYQRQNNTNPPKINGYRASISNHIKVRKLDTLGNLIDALVNAGANGFNGIRFAFSDQKSLLNLARIAAIKDAKATAGLLAHEAGAKLGDVLTIEEISTGGPQPRVMMSMARESSGGVPIMAGEISISTSVRVTYALK